MGSTIVLTFDLQSKLIICEEWRKKTRKILPENIFSEEDRSFDFWVDQSRARRWRIDQCGIELYWFSYYVCSIVMMQLLMALNSTLKRFLNRFPVLARTKRSKCIIDIKVALRVDNHDDRWKYTPMYFSRYLGDVCYLLSAYSFLKYIYSNMAKKYLIFISAVYGYLPTFRFNKIIDSNHFGAN